jgi:outer membrane protein OmpA-like peptidoglycan-associated protein
MKASKFLTTVSSCGLLLAAGCATGQATPHELVAARDAYSRASAGPGMELAPAQLHSAKTALDRAEKAYEEEPESKETLDLAYVAERKSQLAESQAGLMLAEQQKAHAEKVATENISQAHAATQEELARTKEQLAAAEMASKDALSKLKGLQNAVKQDERGVVITLSGAVLFATGKHELLPAARSQLDEIAQALVGAKAQHISVEGFTDSTGSAKRNNHLSEQRAEAVGKYLTSKGLSPEAVKSVGRGSSDPIASNETAEGRATNRRVEIVIQGEQKDKK